MSARFCGAQTPGLIGAWSCDSDWDLAAHADVLPNVSKLRQDRHMVTLTGRDRHRLLALIQVKPGNNISTLA